MPLTRRRPGRARGRLSLTPLRRHASSSGSETSSPSRYFIEDVVVRFGGRLEELVAPPRDLAGQLVGDRDLDLLVPSQRYALRWTRST